MPDAQLLTVVNRLKAFLKAFLKGRALWNCPWDSFIYLRPIDARELVVGDRVAYGHRMDELMTLSCIKRVARDGRSWITVISEKGHFTYFNDMKVYVTSDRRVI